MMMAAEEKNSDWGEEAWTGCGKRCAATMVVTLRLLGASAVLFLVLVLLLRDEQSWPGQRRALSMRVRTAFGGAGEREHAAVARHVVEDAWMAEAMKPNETGRGAKEGTPLMGRGSYGAEWSADVCMWTTVVWDAVTAEGAVRLGSDLYAWSEVRRRRAFVTGPAARNGTILGMLRRAGWGPVGVSVWDAVDEPRMLDGMKGVDDVGKFASVPCASRQPRLAALNVWATGVFGVEVAIYVEATARVGWGRAVDTLFFSKHVGTLDGDERVVAAPHFLLPSRHARVMQRVSAPVWHTRLLVVHPSKRVFVSLLELLAELSSRTGACAPLSDVLWAKFNQPGYTARLLPGVAAVHAWDDGEDAGSAFFVV